MKIEYKMFLQLTEHKFLNLKMSLHFVVKTTPITSKIVVTLFEIIREICLQTLKNFKRRLEEK